MSRYEEQAAGPGAGTGGGYGYGAGGGSGPGAGGAGGAGPDGRARAVRGLWMEEPARRRRMPDPVRTSAVRAVLIVAVTLTLATIGFFLTLTASWLALPMALAAIAGTIVATWGVLDVWITRQMWMQRYGVVSEPSSTARQRRREARRAARAAGREPRPSRIQRDDGPLTAFGRR
ncbi:hypothetical protein [Streptomyces subrutilus]|uniref:Uncharacterized protein n=1 Tax=Streptomyces subrutilus TaxID=36818 RepID=A0A918RAK4_9ACTN|nr:hypothetical protein [Streptomyces subrutilus]WSJ29106.1 hypothetical protein OG479_07140 [Streptomyces subrutilus]GGZ88487.1 hypothetical protein GCM10010371_55530 [Streptomyces subrutilus]